MIRCPDTITLEILQEVIDNIYVRLGHCQVVGSHKFEHLVR